MAEVNINRSSYKASGVYFLEIDNSVVNSTNTQGALRLAVGFNMRGPFNRPVYISNARECTELFGDIDRRLERRGCFTNRAIRTMLKKSPVYALNLLSVDTSDTDTNPDMVGVRMMQLNPAEGGMDGSIPYAQMYERSKFWVADDNTFVENAFKRFVPDDPSMGKDEKTPKTTPYGPVFGFGNCGTKDISIIVRKAEGLTGYNLTFVDWFGSKDNIPYSWINPNDYVSDYFVQVIAVAGDWNEQNYEKYATDVAWKDYFTKDGLKRDMISKFLRLDAVNVIGNWTGCVLPDFIDKQGVNKSIDYTINNKCNETGLLLGINTKAMEKLALGKFSEEEDPEAEVGYFYDEEGDGKWHDGSSKQANYQPDFVGHCITPEICDAFDSFTYMSCNVKDTGKMFFDIEGEYDEDSSTVIVLSAEDGENIAIGDYVRTNSALLTRVTKKRKIRLGGDSSVDGSTGTKIVYKLTTLDVPARAEDNKFSFQKAISDVYDTVKLFHLKGLKITNRHMPGFDELGAENPEAGVEKIYRMLASGKTEDGKPLGDEGIRKGLKNDNMIDFRYIVDTMSYGLGDKGGAKKYLTDFAREKGHCTAICNAPSMTQFAASDAPFFGDTYAAEEGEARPFFNAKYIPMGGNPDMPTDPDQEFFTLPDMEFGADHCGFFSPFLKYADGSKVILVPPAADVSNTFMNKFMGGDPFKTVANLNGILTNGSIVGVEYIFDEEDRGYLEPFGINPIISRNGALMIYGDRTAYQEVNSDLSFLHVRELLNTIEISCKGVLDDYVFASNIATTRAEIISRLNPILAAMKDSGALVKYEIQCDTVNNTKEVIDDKFCIVNIGVWISQNMEKIIVPITLNRSTTANEE